MGTSFAMVGAWLTPDPLGGDITNPQSLNRYAYALNNPTTLTDPSGLGPCSDSNNNCNQGPPSGPFDPPCSVVGMATICYPPGGATWTYPQLSGMIGNWDEFDLMNVPVVTQTWVPPTQVGITMNGVTAWGAVSPGYWSTTVVGNGLMSLFAAPPAGAASGGGGPTWWGTFAKSFFTNFSLKGAKLPGERFGACVSRVQNALLGRTGSSVLNAGTGVSMVSALAGQRFGGGFSVVPGTSEGRLGTSFADLVLEGGLDAGTVSPSTAAAASGAVTVLSKVAVPAFAVAAALEGGFLGACR